MKPRVLIVGGSIAGLTAGLLLTDLGFEVSIFERSASQLAGRGVGIVAHEISLRYLTTHLGAELDELTMASRLLRYLDAAGHCRYEEPSGYRFTSWQALHGRLAAALRKGSLRSGCALLGFDQDERGVVARFTAGRTERGDMLVCADGITSTGRRQLLPGAVPRFAGYVGWRGSIGQQDLGSSLFERLSRDITYQILNAGHILAYPIPVPPAGPPAGATAGASGDGVAANSRSINWVWYRNIPEGPLLDEVMTDRRGRRRSASVPSGEVAPRSVVGLRQAARRELAPDLAELVLRTAQPFVQCIADVEVSRMAAGRVCLIGDAAFVARPHAAAGTAKAAADAWALARALDEADGAIADALTNWEPGQIALGRQVVARSRALGDGVQFQASWRPGDRELLFGLWRPGDSLFPPAGAP